MKIQSDYYLNKLINGKDNGLHNTYFSHTEDVIISFSNWFQEVQKMILENSKVKTLVEREGFPVGTVGIVVSLYSTGPACEVELWNEKDYPVDVVTYLLNELELTE